MKTRALSALFLTVALSTPTQAALNYNPGPVFPLPEDDFFFWNEPMAGIAPGDTLLDFTVLVPASGGFVKVFQVFGACNGFTDIYQARFSLAINGVPTPWTWSEIGNDICNYHTLEYQTLPAGSVDFKVVFLGADAPPPPGYDYSDVRFGNGDIVPAFPVPAPILLLATGFGGIVVASRSRRAERN